MLSSRRRFVPALAAALALAGAAAEAAQASTLTATPSIRGAGSISALPAGPRAGSGGGQCEQAPPVAETAVLQCSTWQGFPGATNRSMGLSITASAAPGWRFSGWTGCQTVSRSTCYLRSEFDENLAFAPQATFEDVAPDKVSDLAVGPIPHVEGTYEAVWTRVTEPGGGLYYECAIDGGAYFACSPHSRFPLSVGDHTVAVRAVDANGHAGDPVSTRVIRVDTTIVSGPAPGAVVRTSRFVAGSTNAHRFECSLDGGPWFTCGTVVRGQPAPLSLPALQDGRHTLVVRGRSGDWTDPFPPSRVWTVDTTDPTPPAARPAPAPAPSPSPAPAPSDAVAPPAPAAPLATTAPAARVNLRVHYRYRHGRLKRLRVTGVPRGTKLAVSVKRPHHRRKRTTLARLRGHRLPRGTKITVRAGGAAKTIRLRRTGARRP